MAERGALTVTSLMAKARDVLADGGYTQVSEEVAFRKQDPRWPSERARLFEDPYGLVAVVAYETWRDLDSGWLDAQEVFVEFISQHINRGEPKAWEGYLVLLTPGIGAGESAMAIRYDTRRVRKLVASSSDVEALADIERVLLPLLPIKEAVTREWTPALEMLPELLANKGVDEADVRILLAAFLEERPLVEELYKHGAGQ